MTSRAGRAAHIATTFVRAGLAGPSGIHRFPRQLAALARWKLTPAGEVRSAAARSPRHVAVIDDERSLTWAELNARTSRIAAGWAAEGPTRRVGILCRNHAGFVEALVASSKLGADAVLLSTAMSGPTLAATVSGHDIDVLVADDEFWPLLDGPGVDPSLRRYSAWPQGEPTHTSLDAIASGPGTSPRLDPPAAPGRTVILTSGTTGQPKGARRRTPKGLGPLCAMLSRIPLRVGDRVMLASPLFHTWAYAGLQLAMALRATMVLRRSTDPEAVVQAIVGTDATAVWVVPIMMRRMIPHAPPTSSLRVVAVSGSSLDGDLATAFMDAFGEVVYNLYGSTEASWATIAGPADLRDDPATAGTPPYGTTVAIVDTDGHRLPVGATGRIVVQHDMLFEGYTNTDDPAAEAEGLPTGDLGRLGRDGRLTVLGRADDMIVSGGENVYPSQVEDVLAARPDILEVAVVGVPDDEYGQRLAAYVVPADGAVVDPEEMRAHVRASLTRFAVPREVHLLDALPRNATGKVLKRDLAPRT